MPTTERLAAIASVRARAMLRELAEELRNARISAGLSQAAVGAAAGVSQRTISRLESGEPPFPDLLLAVRVAVVLGLDLRWRAYPAHSPLRDAAHVKLISRFLNRLPAEIWRQLEAAVRPNDLRAWDVLLVVDGVRIGVIAETRIRDLQALLRREHLKQVDGDVAHLILLVSDTAANRRTLADMGLVLANEFPLGTRAVMTSLSRGAVPSANGIAVL